MKSPSYFLLVGPCADKHVRELAHGLRDAIAAALRAHDAVALTAPDRHNPTRAVAWVKRHAVFQDVVLALDFPLEDFPPGAGCAVVVRRRYTGCEWTLAQKLSGAVAGVLGFAGGVTLLESQCPAAPHELLHGGVQASFLLQPFCANRPEALAAYHRNGRALAEAIACRLLNQFQPAVFTAEDLAEADTYAYA